MYQSNNPVDPISENKLNDAFGFMKQLNALQQRFEQLQPAQRKDAALNGLRHDAGANDVALSAYIMQNDAQARDYVRDTFVKQQAPLRQAYSKRMNYMNSDPELAADGITNATSRFDRKYAETKRVENSPQADSPNNNNTSTAPQKSVRFAPEVKSQQDTSADVKTAQQLPTAKRTLPPSPGKKTPEIPDRSLKPASLFPSKVNAVDKTSLGGGASQTAQIAQNAQPVVKAQNVADESAMNAPKVGNLIARRQQQLLASQPKLGLTQPK